MWTIEDVRTRFVEAAEIERRMYVKNIAASGNAWPSYRFDNDDRDGWDDQARLDDLERWQGRKVTQSAEIARWEECYYVWTLQHIVRPEDRRRIWAWARSQANGPAFVTVCEKRGWVTSTEYARQKRVFSLIAATLTNNRLLFAPPQILAVGQSGRSAVRDIACSGVAPVAAKPKQHPPFRTDKHHDALTSPEAVAAFQAHVADHNDRMRRRRERSMRGVPVAA